VSLSSAAFGFPAITHILSPAREKEVRTGTKMLVRSEDRSAPGEDVCQVEHSGRVFREDRVNDTIHSESGLRLKFVRIE